MRALPFVVAACLLGGCDFPSVPNGPPRHLEPVASPNPGIVPLAAGDVVEADGVLVANAVTSLVVRTSKGWVSLTIGPRTSITLDGTKVGLRAVQPGYPVHVTYRENASAEESRLAVAVDARSGSIWHRQQQIDAARQQNVL